VQISGDSKTAGYWRNEEKTAEMYRAKIKGEENGREYLRTGDLGFFWKVDEKLVKPPLKYLCVCVELFL
jgi:acyl-CoA synthetase (AMP-forming)/AMP-acid ligase II